MGSNTGTIGNYAETGAYGAACPGNTWATGTYALSIGADGKAASPNDAGNSLGTYAPSTAGNSLRDDGNYAWNAGAKNPCADRNAGYASTFYACSACVGLPFAARDACRYALCSASGYASNFDAGNPYNPLAGRDAGNPGSTVGTDPGTETGNNNYA